MVYKSAVEEPVRRGIRLSPELRFIINIVASAFLLIALGFSITLIICGILFPIHYFLEWVTTRKARHPSEVYWDYSENHVRYRSGRRRIW